MGKKWQHEDTKLLNMLLKSCPGLLFLMPVKTDSGGSSSSSSAPNMYFVKFHILLLLNKNIFVAYRDRAPQERKENIVQFRQCEFECTSKHALTTRRFE